MTFAIFKEEAEHVEPEAMRDLHLDDMHDRLAAAQRFDEALVCDTNEAIMKVVARQALEKAKTEEDALARHVVNALVDKCYGASDSAGWWMNHRTGLPLDVQEATPLKLALIHSEISEALEGFRKDAMDDHLPKHKALEVELVDALIRIFDLAGAHKFDLGKAFVAKLNYNATRADHKPENRSKPGGKAF